jgi:GNAT superfamily N-acetyltransferase
MPPIYADVARVRRNKQRSDLILATLQSFILNNIDLRKNLVRIAIMNMHVRLRTAKSDFNPRIKANLEENSTKSTIRKSCIYDNFAERPELERAYSVKMVRDFEDMAKIIAIRASACFADPEHLYAKHFDGNDFSATHFIGHIGSEPVATIRIRYFADFARIERLTVRPTHRKSRIAFRMVQASFAFCREKGYRRLSGVAREEMVPFWSLFGGAVTCSKDPIFIYGLPHFEMHIDFPDFPGAITVDEDPMVLLRPEGRWREAGYHETMNATAPSGVVAQPRIAMRARRPEDVAARIAARRDMRACAGSSEPTPGPNMSKSARGLSMGSSDPADNAAH